MQTAQDGWRAELPDYLMDAKAGRILQLKLDLAAVAATCVSRAACVDFLLRRRSSLGGLSSEAARSELVVVTLKVLAGCQCSGACLLAGCPHTAVLACLLAAYMAVLDCNRCPDEVQQNSRSGHASC